MKSCLDRASRLGYTILLWMFPTTQLAVLQETLSTTPEFIHLLDLLPAFVAIFK